MPEIPFIDQGMASCAACGDLCSEIPDDAIGPVICEGCGWQGFYEAIAHGDDEHRAWLRGMVQGWASAKEGRPVCITKEADDA